MLSELVNPQGNSTNRLYGSGNCNRSQRNVELPFTIAEWQAENYRGWIRQNSERTEFWRIQLRFVIQNALNSGESSYAS